MGGAVTAAAGLATIGEMVAAAPGVEVMAGAGVRPPDVARLAAVGVAAVHLSAERAAPAHRGGTWVPMGAAGSSADADTHFVTDPDTVAAARAAVDAVGPPSQGGARAGLGLPGHLAPDF
ncbi:copper homeostasis protein CutC [Actinacidiphila oryziradicis]|uniref:copper homeostasis protein CutC n=1 Tax=Actinacidiphila oryziradicis TaxID=2571141 RepID=UPI001FECA625|nr:copper homeostasis protein CutC [Actinacidiphila oryziradicis]